jgi:F-box protein 21
VVERSNIKISASPIMASIPRGLASLPTELLQAIFTYLPPESMVAIQLTSTRFKDIANEQLLWRYHCSTQWKYWNADHEIAKKFAGPVDAVNWKLLFVKRKEIDRLIFNTLNDILSTQQGRNLKINRIVEKGYDAKDELLRQCHPPADAEDILARAFWSEAVLNCIHRSMAINEWKSLRESGTGSLESALGAFDMFVLGTRPGDLADTAGALDALARRCREQHPEFDGLSTRAQALILASFLRSQGFTGVSDERYLNLRNNFIGISLQDDQHESLPLITVATYVSVAERLGLRAECCAYPFHIYAIVTAPRGYCLDGKQSSEFESRADKMYLDPFRSEVEVAEETLRQNLSGLGIHSQVHDMYLHPASTRELVLRTSRNIMRSVQELQEPEGANRLSAAKLLDTEDAFYAAAWANLMLTIGVNDGEGGASAIHRRQMVSLFTGRFQGDFPWDSVLIENYMMPLFENLPELNDIQEVIRLTLFVDEVAKHPVRRAESGRNVKYKIGETFQHKRYGYEGVITGWDPLCDAGEAWIQHMGVDNLLRGRTQAFYHVL